MSVSSRLGPDAGCLLVVEPLLEVGGACGLVAGLVAQPPVEKPPQDESDDQPGREEQHIGHVESFPEERAVSPILRQAKQMSSGDRSHGHGQA